jgi:hypothetical protein
MGQMLEFTDDLKKKKEIPTSLDKLKENGFLNAAFSDSEIEILINNIGSFIKLGEHIDECCI